MIDKAFLNYHQREYLEKCDRIRASYPSLDWTQGFITGFCDWIKTCLQSDSTLEVSLLPDNAFGCPLPLLGDLRAILTGHGQEMNLICYLVGRSLGELGITEKPIHSKLMDLCAQWDASEGVADVISAHLSQSEGIEFCHNAIHWLNVNPESGIVGEYERARFKDYYTHWFHTNDIKSIWRNDWEYFWPHVNIVDILARLLAKRPDLIAPLLGEIRNPLAARNLLDSMYIEYDFGLLKKLLGILPSCLLDTGSPRLGWNKALIPPLLLPRLIESASKLSPQDRQEFCTECGKMLLEREDGLFLAWNYIPRLHFTATFIKDQGQAALEFMDGILENVCESGVLPVCKDWIEEEYGESFLSKTGAEYKGYVETGALSEGKTKEMLEGIVSFCRLLPEQALAAKSGVTLLQAYRRCWAYEDVLATSASSTNLPDMAHDAISSLYANSESPAAYWLADAKALISPALARMIYGRNVADTAKLDFEINFHLAVGWQLAYVMFMRKEQEELQRTISNVSEICYELDQARRQRVHDFPCRVLANLGSIEFENALARSGQNKALQCVEKFIEKWREVPSLAFELFEMLHANDFDPLAMRATHPKLIELYREAYEKEPMQAANRRGKTRKMEDLERHCEKRLQVL